MRTTNQHTAVARDGVARMITELLLQPRRCYLKHRAPKSAYVHQLRRDIAAGKARPVEMLLSISASDLEDRVPLSLVLQPYQAAIAELTEHHGELAGTTRPMGAPDLLPAIQREARTESGLRAAENDVLAHPDSATAIDHAVQAVAMCEPAYDQLAERLRTGRARLTNTNTVIAAVR